MSELSSVNKIKSLTQQIESITGKSHSDLTIAIQALKDGYESDSSGSGIIDVTELPIENIDENAVYRVTESVQINFSEVYIVTSDGVVTAQQFFGSLGTSTTTIYVVNELSPDLKITDIQSPSEVNLYILRSDGFCYMNVPDFGGFATLGLLGFEDTGYDKGFTDNAYEEMEEGVYTTLETYKEVIRYFIRKNGEWKEISAVMSKALQNGFNDVDVLSGVYQSEDITVKSKTIDIKSLIKNDRVIPSKVIVDTLDIADFMDYFCDIKEISREFFYKSNGELVYNLRNHIFSGLSYLETVSIPDEMRVIPANMCSSCSSLKNINFPQNLEFIYTRAFESCNSLEEIVIPERIIQIGDSAFADCSALATVTVKGKPQYFAGDTFMNSGVTTINVPWSEGEVEGAPWGATNATINYNYTGG